MNVVKLAQEKHQLIVMTFVMTVRSAYNGRCDLCSLNSVVAVFSGGVTTVLKFCNLQIL